MFKKICAAAMLMISTVHTSANAMSRTVHMKIEVQSFVPNETVKASFRGPYMRYGVEKHGWTGTAHKWKLLYKDEGKGSAVDGGLAMGEYFIAASKDRIHGGHTRSYELHIWRHHKIVAKLDINMKINLKGVRRCYITKVHDPHKYMTYSVARKGKFDNKTRREMALHAMSAGAMDYLNGKWSKDVEYAFMNGDFGDFVSASVAALPGPAGKAGKAYAGTASAVEQAIKSGPDSCLLSVQVMPKGKGIGSLAEYRAKKTKVKVENVEKEAIDGLTSIFN